MAAKTKKLSMLRLWFLPVLFLLAAFPASASLPRLAKSRVWLPRDFAPLSLRAERGLSPERQGVFEGFNCELTLEPSIDPDGRCANAAYQTVGQYAQGIVGLANNAYYSASYGVASLVYGTDQASQWYGQNWQGLKQMVTGTAQTAYDAAAFASFEMLSPIAPELSAQAYGPSIDRLYNLDTVLTGGQDNSAAYRTTATIANAGLFVLGGEVGNLGRASEVAEAAPTAYSVAFEMQLAPEQFGLRQAQHFQIANQALEAEQAVNPALAELVPAPVNSSVAPAGWTWHHALYEQADDQFGVMQLVPRAQHTSSAFWPLFHPENYGGYWEWAIPAGAPPRR